MSVSLERYLSYIDSKEGELRLLVDGADSELGETEDELGILSCTTFELDFPLSSFCNVNEETKIRQSICL